MELTPIPSDLTTMYWVIDEVSLPDVENGYFVHPALLVADHFGPGVPARTPGNK
ncbi:MULTISPECIES: hypothetical protein [unclassified Streptomyces]|uniref:hypothetical protein n=1 Tax=unclassified Streptomyces TaxID=2593676 RepID=UPI00225A63C4|nr:MULTISPECIES: hypothetical protein [unclassified Streptomyces]MCX4404449.1 hypothetical protein [Streptomyces sp. NBC_01764]MCX5191010.1 hypothetical protein [Streptomyces sp. NBC_00268]